MPVVRIANHQRKESERYLGFWTFFLVLKLKFVFQADVGSSPILLLRTHLCDSLHHAYIHTVI